MKRTITTVLFLLLLTLPVSADKIPCSNARYSPYTPSVPTGYEHNKYGIQSNCLVQEFSAFTSCFDTDDDDDMDGDVDYYVVPEWVAYEIKRYGPESNEKYCEPDPTCQKPTMWYDDHDLDFVYNQPEVDNSNRLDDSYNGIGDVYNRGHLCMKLHAIRLGWEAGCETFTFANGVPQHAKFNQGIWKGLEYYTGAAANKFGSVWIITGPIFLKRVPVPYIGDPGEVPIAIPHFLFKIVVKKSGTPIPDTLAFIYPQLNLEMYNTGKYKYNHANFLTSIKDIEDFTGLTFFTNVSMTDEQRTEFKSRVADSLWEVENEYFEKSCD